MGPKLWKSMKHSKHHFRLNCLWVASWLDFTHRQGQAGSEGEGERPGTLPAIIRTELGWQLWPESNCTLSSQQQRRGTTLWRGCIIILRVSVGLTDWQTKRGSQTESGTDKETERERERKTESDGQSVRWGAGGNRDSAQWDSVAICVRLRLICRRCDLMDSWANRMDRQTSL